jgi:electron transfer flavoprotein alpha subunit
MSGVLVYSERPPLALQNLTFAYSLGCPAAAAVLGPEGESWSEQYFNHGAERVYCMDDPSLSGLQADVVSEALCQIADLAEAEIILISSTLRGREVAGRLAQKLHVGCITDAAKLRAEEGQWIATRYSLGGKTLSEQVLTSGRKVIAVNPNTFQAEPLTSGVKGDVVEVAPRAAASPVRIIEQKPKPDTGVNIESADVVICVGRGLESEDDLGMIRELADILGGVVACTRPISHDRHWLPEERMVGISGKKISPSLYFGIGVSGQIQQMAAVLDAKVIVAINNDRNAPIFQNADYGIVGDLYKVIPDMIDKLSR